MVLMIWKHY